MSFKEEPWRENLSEKNFSRFFFNWHYPIFIVKRFLDSPQEKVDSLCSRSCIVPFWQLEKKSLKIMHLKFYEQDTLKRTFVHDYTLQDLFWKQHGAILRIIGRKRNSGFLRIFTEALLLFLAPKGSSKPVGLIF